MELVLLLLAAGIGLAIGEGLRRRANRTQTLTGDGSRRLP
jgi:hypothetical protein